MEYLYENAHAAYLFMLAFSFSTFFITHLMEILMFLRALSDQLEEIFKSTTSTRSILAVGNRSRCRVRNEADELAGSIAGDGTTIASHFLHANMAKEWN